MEGESSRNAQYFGWLLGYYGTPSIKQVSNLLRSQEKARNYVLLKVLRSLMGIK